MTGASKDGLPRLPRVSGPNNSDRETLGKRLKSRQLYAEILGWLVGLGLLVEYWDELVDCVVNWHWPSRPLSGGLLVTLGVFGEVLFSRLALITSDKLQDRADSEVSQANERAAQALDRATKAEQATAEANLARVKIEKKFEARSLTEEAKADLRAFLAPYGRKRVDVFAYDSHVLEAHLLADSINGVFISAGWDSKLWLAEGHRPAATEFTIASARESTHEENSSMQHLAFPLAGILHRHGIRAAVAMNGFSKREHPGNLRGFCQWTELDIASLRVQVGEKQLIDPFA